MAAKSTIDLNKLDLAYKIVFIIGFILMVVVAAVVTHNATTKPLTGSQVAAVGYIAVFLLLLAGIIYSHFPESVLGKPKNSS
ncbi:MAG: hypothetical protein OWQ54_02520 [Sulfolobaceae archaeon]|nr:hypothetical protein [Sulfolobaceae archaeon]